MELYFKYAVPFILVLFGWPIALPSAELGNYIDVHMHLDGKVFGQTPGQRRNGPGSVPGFRRQGPSKNYDLAASKLIRLMDQNKVAKVLVMPPPQSVGQRGGYTYHEFLNAIRKYPNRLILAAGGGELNPIIMGTKPADITDLVKADFTKKAEELIHDGIKAFGEMTALHFSFNERHVFETVDPDHPLFLLLADIAAKHGIAIDLHMEAVPMDQSLPQSLVRLSPNNPSSIKANISGFERLLSHNRKANIVWQHIGWDNTGHMTVDLLRSVLKKHSNLFLAIKIVQASKEPFRRGQSMVDNQMKIKDHWLKIIQDFPDRFVVGADEFVGVAPAANRPRGGPPSFVDTWSLIEQLPEDLRVKVGRENAKRIYNL